MALSTVTITWDETDIGQAGLNGSIRFAPNTTWTDTLGHTVIEPQPLTFPILDSAGESTPLVANDSAGLLPSGSYYVITVLIAGLPPRQFNAFIDFANGASQTLGSLSPLVAVPVMLAYLPLPSGGPPTAGQVPSALGDGSQNSEWGAGGGGGGLPLTGGTLTGPLIINDVPSGAPSGLPVGYGDSVTVNGLQIASSHPSDDVTNGIDGTGRILLYSYQRANVYGFGEVIRRFLMRYDAKAMDAWYGPVSLYDGSGNAITTGGWHPWAWSGAHYEGNDDSSLHLHWEVEVPDSTGAMQGRFEIPFGNTTTGVIGLDLTTINTNLANFHFYCHGLDHTGAYQEQFFRLTAPAGFEKALEWNDDNAGTQAFARWRMAATADAESGSNAGTNWALYRYSDGGTQLGAPITIARSTGIVLMTDGGAQASFVGVGTAPSGTVPLLVTGGSSNVTAARFLTSASGGGGNTQPIVQAEGQDTSNRAYAAALTTDASMRWAVYTDGTTQWGTGAANRDVQLQRTAAGQLTLTDLASAGNAVLLVGGSLQAGGTTAALGGGSGVIGISNAGTNPSSNPSGGGVLWSQGGALKWLGPSGGALVLTATLDVIASQQAPVAAVALNGQKITGLANGTASSDAAAFGQIPAALPPNGSAGGVLSGTYPNPGLAASPALTGTPTAPTAVALTSTTQIATTAYADSAVGVEKTRALAAEALLAPLASPALTGTPTAPTKTALTNNTDIATTAYADAAVAVEVSRAEAAEALLAPLASPALTGTPTAPTKTPLTSNTDIATTAYADAAVAARVVSGQFMCTPTQYAPGSATPLATTSATLAAVSSANVNTGSFTTAASGPGSTSVLVTASLNPSSSGSNVYAFALAAHGTVTPVVGNVITSGLSSLNQHPPHVMIFVVTGLTASTTYNLDLLFAVAGGTLTVNALGQTSTTPTGTLGSPVTMTVQAI